MKLSKTIRRMPPKTRTMARALMESKRAPALLIIGSGLIAAACLGMAGFAVYYVLKGDFEPFVIARTVGVSLFAGVPALLFVIRELKKK